MVSRGRSVNKKGYIDLIQNLILVQERTLFAVLINYFLKCFLDVIVQILAHMCCTYLELRPEVLQHFQAFAFDIFVINKNFRVVSYLQPTFKDLSF